MPRVGRTTDRRGRPPPGGPQPRHRPIARVSAYNWYYVKYPNWASDEGFSRLGLDLSVAAPPSTRSQPPSRKSVRIRAATRSCLVLAEPAITSTSRTCVASAQRCIRCAVACDPAVTLHVAILTFMRRGPRRLAAWLALGAIFFAQLATAAYACPDIEAALSGPPSAESVSAPCAGMGMGKAADGSSLCVEHCKFGQQLVDTHPTSDPSDRVPVLAFVVTTLVDDASARSRSIEPILAHATAPPIFASSGRLRI